MRGIYFLDTSYILALEIKNEEAHQKVLQNWATLIKFKPFLITTTYIFEKVITFFNGRNLHYKAVEVRKWLLESPEIELIEIERTLFNQGWEYFQNVLSPAY
ncbi:MAG: PIN domain-containing protein [Nostoc sp.]|uniref:PIN domain-containing protein n=1 Tax=Nostoc sp. TaxID=1180 RepID=UPI002FF6E95E